MNRFNFGVLKRLWKVAKPYWLGSEKKGAIALLTVLIFFSIVYTLLNVVLNSSQGVIISALAKQNEQRFWQTILIMIGALALYVPIFSGSDYIQFKLSNYWRRWLTRHFLGRYLHNLNFYKLGNFNTQIDNPDQRIAEDINNFTRTLVEFTIVFIVSITQGIAFSVVLFKILPILVVFLVIYSIVGPIITVVFFGKKLVNLNLKQLKKEADFRFNLVRIRDNSESIAFYRGEPQEAEHLRDNFERVFNNFSLLILWREFYLGLFTNPYQFIPTILPAIIVAPTILAGDLEVGKLSEASGAFLRIFFYLNIFVSKFQELTNLSASIDRLSAFENYLQQSPAKAKILAKQPTIYTMRNDRLAIEGLTLKTPNYQRTLIRNLNVKLANQQGLLIVGASGCGKSSLLRAIAGLWNSGTGTIYRPSLAEMLFLPQKPYMILGSLRSQLLYPHVNSDRVSDEQLQGVLKTVNLPYLVNRCGGIDAEQDWADFLSLGEQQRLAFARILLNQPRYAVLDEATSALDIKNEASLYQLLQQNGITFISVGHRPSLNQYHQLILEIKEEAKWNLRENNNNNN